MYRGAFVVVRITYTRYLLYVRSVPTVPTLSLGFAARTLEYGLWSGHGQSWLLVVLFVRAFVNSFRLYVRTCARAGGGNPWSSMSETIVYSGPVDDR